MRDPNVTPGKHYEKGMTVAELRAELAWCNDGAIVYAWNDGVRQVVQMVDRPEPGSGNFIDLNLEPEKGV